MYINLPIYACNVNNPVTLTGVYSSVGGVSGMTSTRTGHLYVSVEPPRAFHSFRAMLYLSIHPLDNASHISFSFDPTSLDWSWMSNLMSIRCRRFNRGIRFTVPHMFVSHQCTDELSVKHTTVQPRSELPCPYIGRAAHGMLKC